MHIANSVNSELSHSLMLYENVTKEFFSYFMPTYDKLQWRNKLQQLGKPSQEESSEDSEGELLSQWFPWRAGAGGKMVGSLEDAQLAISQKNQEENQEKRAAPWRFG